MPTKSLLILSAGMGAGHDGVALELARRLSADGVDATVVDVLELMPLRLGSALRWWYRETMRAAPWLYGAIYRIFFVADRAPSTSPLTVLLATRLDRLVRRDPPAAVVSTFHLAAQAAGRLRERGRLPVASTVLLTDFAVHRLWLHPGNDGYLCPTGEVAALVAEATGRPAVCHAPVVRPEFRWEGTGMPDVRRRIGARPDDRLVLISAGAWGLGRVEETARVVAGSGRYLPVILCGRNRRLRRRLCDAGTGVALGWRADMSALMSGAYALIDNAAGLTAREALAAGVPVVSYRPIPGHGRDGARAMAAAGLSVHACDAVGLLAALDRLDVTAVRAAQVARGAALFASPPAETLLRSALT